MNKQVIFRRNELLGKEFETNSCGKCFIIDYQGSSHVLVAFYEPFCIVKCRIDALLGGYVKNPMRPSFYDKGFIGVGNYGAKDKKLYRLWSGVMQRACAETLSKRSITYKGVTICDEWLNFQNFAAWCDKQYYFNAKDDKGKSYHLDKDILVKGNKVYSPNTCCFVPQEVNGLLLSSKTNRGDLPIGVHYYKPSGKYIVQINFYGNLKHVGLYDTPKEAFLAYKKVKESHIKDVAEKWKSRVDVNVYQALLKYEVDFDD